MNDLANTAASWVFPGCPQPPDWCLAWPDLLSRFAWLRLMADTPQDPVHHAEGNVQIHTGMVAEALVGMAAWRELEPHERSILFAAALLHDVAKPLCTEIDPQGRVRSPRHAQKGQRIARELLWRDAHQYEMVSFAHREQIAWLVRFHGLPLSFIDAVNPEHMLALASQSVRLDRIALLAEADSYGRVCSDQRDLLDRVELFRQLAKELACYQQPRAFASNHSRFVYFRNQHRSLTYDAYDDRLFEVVLMAGLPGVGKDTWLSRNLTGLPIISLDRIREELKITPTEPHGPVVLAAKQRAREFLQRRQPFVWNATNLTRPLRRQLIHFFADYQASVRIVYLDAPFETILKRNRSRPDPVPQRVIERMLSKCEVPDPTEAHVVEYVCEH